MIEDEDLAYIKANTPPDQYVEFANTGIDNNGEWFARTSTEDVPLLPITGYWVHEGANAYHDNVSIRTNPYFWFTAARRDWRAGFMSQMPVKLQKA